MRRRQDGKIVLIDFGAVKEVEAMTVNTQGQTSLSVAIGSLGYMPSEQAAGRPKLSSDVYAVGMLGIQALTGLQPNELPKDPNDDEVIWRNRANVTEKLADALNKMVSYYFRDRYPSAVEALAAIKSLQPQQRQVTPTIPIPQPQPQRQAPPTIPTPLPQRRQVTPTVPICEKLSQKTGKTYRLPSEAEWEYACRAGTTTPFYFGETITTDLVNYNGNSTYASAPKGQYRQQTTPVGSFPPNAFGLYDMHGNVWEWCQDHWHDNYNGAPTDGSAWTDDNDNRSRLLRGGY
jgi:serine/threonine protein kinase